MAISVAHMIGSRSRASTHDHKRTPPVCASGSPSVGRGGARSEIPDGPPAAGQACRAARLGGIAPRDRSLTHRARGHDRYLRPRRREQEPGCPTVTGATWPGPGVTSLTTNVSLMAQEFARFRDLRWSLKRGLSEGSYVGAFTVPVIALLVDLRHESGLTWRFWTCAGAFVAVLAVFVWRYTRSALNVDGHRLTIRNPFRVYRYDVGEVVSLVPERVPGSISRRSYLAAAVRERDGVRRRKIVALSYDAVTFGVLPAALLDLAVGPEVE